jgi:protein-disulfide isomerase
VVVNAKIVLSKSSKKSFAVIAIIVGVVGVGIGVYSIATIGSRLEQTTIPSEWVLSTGTEELHPLALNGSPLLGSSNAPITIVEYGDYQCSNCQRFATQVKPLIIENYINTGKVKLIFKDFTIYGSDSVNGAIAAHCANEQNKFWEMHDFMYQNQKAINSGWLSVDSIKKLASDIDLDTQQFKTCFDSKKYAQKVTENFNDGKAAGVKGTPTFIIINGEGQMVTVQGAQPFSTFKQVLDKMLEG